MVLFLLGVILTLQLFNLTFATVSCMAYKRNACLETFVYTPNPGYKRHEKLRSEVYMDVVLNKKIWRVI